MFFRRVFAKNQHDYGKEISEETSSDHQSPPSPPPPVKMQKRRASIEENQSRGLSVLQLTPLWEHIIRTNSMPRSINLSDVFNEFFERLRDPEWQVRQHALRVLVDVLIVMGQQADYHIQNLVHPLVDNLGHIAPAVRKGALDALRVYVAQTSMPETVMLDIMTYGMDRPAKDPFSGRMTVAVLLALPALILPILITAKRGYVVKAVIDALAGKMVKITYQEIALKILIKIRDMVGTTEFFEQMPSNVKKDFELLCKVYGLPKHPAFEDDMHVPSNEARKPWASRFVPRKDIQGNIPSSHAPLNGSDGSKYFGTNYDATYPFERTRLSNNLGTPKKARSPRHGSGGILRSSSDNNLTVDFNGNSSGSESGGSSLSLRTQNNTAANSITITHETVTCSSQSCSAGNNTQNRNYCEKREGDGKVIMETEIKITPETAVTMRILEQNPSTQTDDSEEDTGSKRIITDFSAPYPVTPMRVKNPDENNNFRFNDSAGPKNGRRVRFGGEIVKMRTPDSEAFDQSDDYDNEPKIVNLPIPHHKEKSHYSDNSSVSSDNSMTHEYIKPANVGFVNEPLSLNQFKTNIDHLKEKKFDGARSVQTPSINKPDSQKSTRSAPIPARPSSAKPPSTPTSAPLTTRPLSTDRSVPSSRPVAVSNPMNSRLTTISNPQDSFTNSRHNSTGNLLKSVNKNIVNPRQNSSGNLTNSYNYSENSSKVNQNHSENTSNSRPTSSSRPPVVHSPPTTPLKAPEQKMSSSSSTDYSQELTIGIPDVDTVLPAHFTPPNVVIKKTMPAHYQNFNQMRPATSPMISPRIVMIPPTSSSSYSSKNTSPNKSAPSTPNLQSPSKRSRPQSPDRTPIRRSVSSLSPRMMHREVTMMHNLQRSPISSPARARKASISSMDFEERARNEEATQTSVDQATYNPRSDEMTQTPNGCNRIDEMTQTSMFGELKCSEKASNSVETTPTSSKESPVVQQQSIKSWEELGIVDFYVLKDLKSGVSKKFDAFDQFSVYFNLPTTITNSFFVQPSIFLLFAQTKSEKKSRQKGKM